MGNLDKITVFLDKIFANREKARFWYWLFLTVLLIFLTLDVWSAVYEKTNLVMLFYVAAGICMLLLLFPLYQEIKIVTPFGEFHGINARRNAARRNEFKATEEIIKAAEAQLHALMLNSPSAVSDDILKLINTLKGKR